MTYVSTKKYISAILKSSIIVSIVIIFISIIGSVDIRTILLYQKYIIVSFVLIIIQYIVKGIRFYIICKDFLDDTFSFWKAVLIRVSSEFFSLIGMSYVGDESFRIYYLNKKVGVNLADASVIGYLEVLAEVIIAVTIVFTGIIYLIFQNIINIILYILIVSTSIVALFHFLLVFRTGYIRRFISWVLKKISYIIKSDRLYSYISSIDSLLSSFETGLSQIIGKKKLFSLVIMLTYTTAFIGGLALWVIAVPEGVDMNFYTATVILYMSLVLSSLPITISGSGIFELVILLSGKAFSGDIPWSLPISFRISSYYLPLLLTIGLIYYVMRDFMKS